MPKESPNTSSLWTGPQNPRNRAGQAAAVPTRPWWGALVSSSPQGPPCPCVPVPRAGRVTRAGLSPPRDQGTGAARAAVSEWGRWHDTPHPGPWCWVGIGGAPGAGTAGGTPQHGA